MFDKCSFAILHDLWCRWKFPDSFVLYEHLHLYRLLSCSVNGFLVIPILTVKFSAWSYLWWCINRPMCLYRSPQSLQTYGWVSESFSFCTVLGFGALKLIWRGKTLSDFDHHFIIIANLKMNRPFLFLNDFRGHSWDCRANVARFVHLVFCCRFEIISYVNR